MVSEPHANAADDGVEPGKGIDGIDIGAALDRSVPAEHRPLRRRPVLEPGGEIDRTALRRGGPVEFKTGGSTRREVIQVSEREQTFNFKLDAKPQSVALDPDEWVLKVLTINEWR